MAMVQTAIDPRALAFRPWAEAIRLQNSDLPRPPDEGGWVRWALSTTQFEINAPDPRYFQHWQDWAAAWMQAV